MGKIQQKKAVIISIIVCLLITFMPAQAFAADAVTVVDSKEDLVSAIEAGGSVQLGADITLENNQSFNISGIELTLDLNGFDLVRPGESSRPLFELRNGGTLTINDTPGTGTITSSYPVQLYSNSTFILNGGDISSPKGAAVDIFDSASNVLVEINGGSVSGAADNTFGVRGSSNVKVNINGGVISSVPGNRLAMYISGSQDNAIEINFASGMIRAQEQAIQAYSGAVINVSGEAEIYSETGTAISTQSGYGMVELNVTGGSITTDGPSAYAIQAGEESQVNISGGSVTGGTAVWASDNTTISVTGGEIKGSRSDISEESGSAADITVTGGTFSKKINEKYLLTGTESSQDADGNYTVVKPTAIYIDGTAGSDSNTGADEEHAVKTLEYALKLVADGGTIYVCGEVTVTDTLTISNVRVERADGNLGKLITVDGENAELTIKDAVIDGKKADGNSPIGYLVFITNGATANIEDGAQIINNNTTAVYVNNRSFLNMTGGRIGDNTIVNPIDGFYYSGAGIYNAGTTNITGGEISGNVVTDYDGGGISSQRGTIIIGGNAVITNNQARTGAGISVSGSIAILQDNASITGNTSAWYGAGVYISGYENYDQVTTRFEMKGGSITDNTVTGGYGGGIYGYYPDKAAYKGDDSVIAISGGIISGNSAAYGGDGISIGSAETDYPTVNLSGSPDISDAIMLCDGNAENGYQINVVGTFDPASVLTISRQNQMTDIPAVVYEDGVLPNANDFVPARITDILQVDGQYIMWREGQAVYFFDGENEYTDNRHGVITGGLIDAASVPAPQKAGYTLLGWIAEGETEYWDFATDTVTKTARLYADWSLDAPAVTISAEKTEIHESKTAELTAQVSHDAAGVTYSYQWYKDGSPVSGATASTLTVSDGGSYTVKATASDGTLTSAETESGPVEITVQGHNFVWVTDKEATATEAGSKHEECTICGLTKAAVSIPATGEDSGDDSQSIPTTGDTENLILWIAAMFIAGSAAAGTGMYKNKKK